MVHIFTLRIYDQLYSYWFDNLESNFLDLLNDCLKQKNNFQCRFLSRILKLAIIIGSNKIF